MEAGEAGGEIATGTQHCSQDETIARWVKEKDEEKRLSEAYRAVYQSCR
jgi:hypothetical protein